MELEPTQEADSQNNEDSAKPPSSEDNDKNSKE
jgi:hypothetical protein